MLKTPRDTSKSRPIHVRENSISPFDAYRLVIAVRGRKVHVSRQTGVSKLDFLLWLYYALIHCKWSESLAISKARGSIYMSFGKWKIILSQSVILLTSFTEFVVVSIETPEINCDRLFSLRVRLSNSTSSTTAENHWKIPYHENKKNRFVSLVISSSHFIVSKYFSTRALFSSQLSTIKNQFVFTATRESIIWCLNVKLRSSNDSNILPEINKC